MKFNFPLFLSFAFVSGVSSQLGYNYITDESLCSGVPCLKAITIPGANQCPAAGETVLDMRSLSNQMKQYWSFGYGVTPGQFVIASAAACTPATDVRVLGVDSCNNNEAGPTNPIKLFILNNPPANFSGINNTLLWTRNGDGRFYSVYCPNMVMSREAGTGNIVLTTFTTSGVEYNRQTFNITAADSEVSTNFMYRKM